MAAWATFIVAGKGASLSRKGVSFGWFLMLVLWSETGYGLRLSQIQFDLAVAAGHQETASFSVTNDADRSMTLDISLTDWERDLDGTNRLLPPGTLARSAAPWMTVTPNQLELAPGDAAEVAFTLDVPSNVEGTYWSAISLEEAPRPSQAQGETVLTVRQRVVVKVLQTAPGTGNVVGKVASVRVGGLNPLTVAVRFENQGTTNLPAVRGRWEVRDAQGEPLVSQAIESFPVLPGAVRQLSLSSERPLGDVLPPGRYLILVVMDFDGAGVVAGQRLLVIEPLNLIPIGNGTAPPRDLDGDALYEDVNGDGRFTEDDAVLLGFEIASPAVQTNARAFDFDNDGDADFDDVLQLKALLQG